MTNDLYLSPVPESGAELFLWQSTEAGAVTGLGLAASVLVAAGFAGEAGIAGLTEVQAVSPPCTEIPLKAGDEPARIAALDAIPVVALFIVIAVRGAPWSCCRPPIRTGLDVRS